MVKKALKTDATKKILGIEYQKLIALEKCLNAQKDDVIWLEFKGDVSNGENSTEVKHHTVKNHLTSNAVDAWKTINQLCRAK